MYTELDDVAHILIRKDYNEGKMISKISKPYFVNNKLYYPYTCYYEKAKLLLRMIKLKKIKNNLDNSKKDIIFVS